MFSALISAVLGAAVCSICGKSWRVLTLGACLGWCSWFAFAGAQCGQCLPTYWEAGPIGMGALYLFGRIPGADRRSWIDIPGDARILVPTSIGFLIRGAWPSGWVTGGVVALDVLVFCFVLGTRLPKPPIHQEDPCRTARLAMAPPTE